VGILPDAVYTVDRLALPASGRAVVVSDGLTEEPSVDEPPDDPSSGRLDQFGSQGVKRILCDVPGETAAVRALFEAALHHAGRPGLADDASAVIVSW
jgi:serine phosphatase RsbU (regulator of sigma subunit)